MFALLLLTAWLRPCAAQGNELVMATTFSPSATVWIIDRWQKEPGSVMIRTLNRTSASLEQLLDTANAENVDLILTSSPMLLQHLQEHQKLAAVQRCAGSQPTSYAGIHSLHLRGRGDLRVRFADESLGTDDPASACASGLG